VNILYLEDNQMDAALVQRYIETTDHQLDVVATLDDADAVLSDNTDLLLIDIMIDNERSGLDFVRYLRDRGFDKQIIAVTALSSNDDIENCREVGCNAVLIKPFNITQLAEIINY